VRSSDGVVSAYSVFPYSRDPEVWTRRVGGRGKGSEQSALTYPHRLRRLPLPLPKLALSEVEGLGEGGGWGEGEGKRKEKNR
jgi:hypothetical protein